MNFLKKIRKLFKEKLWFRIVLTIICIILSPIILLICLFNIAYTIIELNIEEIPYE
jgi:hypothetical protein